MVFGTRVNLGSFHILVCLWFHIVSVCADDLHDVLVDLRLCEEPALSTSTGRDMQSPIASRKLAEALFDRILHCVVPGHTVSSTTATFGYTTFVRWAAPLDHRL